MKTTADIAALLAARVRRPNPIMPGQVVEALALSAGTPTATVRQGGTTRRAIWLTPQPVLPGGNIFLCRLGPDPAAPWATIATNYQVSGGGLGTGALGLSPLGE